MSTIPAAEKLLAASRAMRARRSIRVGRGTDAAADAAPGVERDRSWAGRERCSRTPRGRFEVALPLLGDFNVENLLVAAGIARGPRDRRARRSRRARRRAARCRAASSASSDRADAEPTVLVDYAHTPDAVDKVLRTVRPLCRGRLVAVFGCGGDRDRTKRPRDGRGGRRAAPTVAIVDQRQPAHRGSRSRSWPTSRSACAAWTKVARRGALRSARRHDACYATIVDRREAIRCAIGSAAPDDTIVLAGKGHEDYQIIGREKLPFDDRDRGPPRTHGPEQAT